KMIEKMYGEEVFYQDAIEILQDSVCDRAINEAEEEIVAIASFDVNAITKGQPVVFVLEVALKPEVTLGQYKGVEVDKIDTTVTVDEVEAALKAEQKKQARTIEVTDRAVAADDTVTLDFEGFVDGVAFEGGKGTDYPLTIGSGSFIPGFEDALIGAEIGKEVDVNVTFPEEYQEASLAGKPAVFKCTVKAIKAQELPELNDEFASEVSEFDTLADYKDSIKADLEVKKLSDAKMAKQDAVIDKIIETSSMDIPEAYIKTEQRQMVNEFAQRMQSQGLSMEQYMQFTGATVDKLLEQVKPQAESRIKSRLVLEAVAAAENITVSEDDYKEELKSMAEAYQIDEEKIADMVGEEGKKQIEKDIIIKKALEFVADNAVEK
ncbi:MAG: trigger factor, partial [Lachnospiraceae bacterium]|nr:trigger factor [Lachnospiraceae bacterium]